MPTMNRITKQRKLRRVQAVVGVTAFAGLGLFADLAAHTGHTAAQQVTTPDQQITSLENAGGGSFFSLGEGAPMPPSAGTSQPQASSGGS